MDAPETAVQSKEGLAKRVGEGLEPNWANEGVPPVFQDKVSLSTHFSSLIPKMLTFTLAISI